MTFRTAPPRSTRRGRAEIGVAPGVRSRQPERSGAGRRPCRNRDIYDLVISDREVSRGSVVSDERLAAWAVEPADTTHVMECALTEVRGALSPLDAEYGELELFVQGGYSNGTAVSVQSDIDIVIRRLSVPVSRIAEDPEGPAARAYRGFRSAVLDAIRSELDPGVRDPRIACRCHVGTSMVDVVPCLPFRPRDEPERDDIWLWPDAYYNEPIISWPRLIHTLIERRDCQTDGHFRPLIRALKGLRDELSSGEERVAGFVVESLAFAATLDAFAAPTIRERCRAVLASVQDQLLDDDAARSFTDPSGRQLLFGARDRASPALDAAQGFLQEATAHLA